MITLQPLSRDDATDKYLSWLNDPEVTKYLEVGNFPMTKEHLIGYIDKMNETTEQVLFGICLDGKFIGTITLNDINWIHRIANVGIMIGDKTCWRHGYGTEATRQLVYYAFNRLNLQKVWAGVHALNQNSIKMFERAGFFREAALNQERYLNGQYHVKYIMSIFNA